MYIISIGNSMALSAIWKKHARVSFSEQNLKKIIYFDWLRAVQFLGNTEYQKKKFSAYFFRF